MEANDNPRSWISVLTMNLLYKTVANLLSPAGERARLSILIYHRVLADSDPIFPTEATVASFDSQLQAVKSA